MYIAEMKQSILYIHTGLHSKDLCCDESNARPNSFKRRNFMLLSPSQDSAIESAFLYVKCSLSKRDILNPVAKRRSRPLTKGELALMQGNSRPIEADYALSVKYFKEAKINI